MSQRIREPGMAVAPPKFGGEILRARKDACLSLDELARRSGVSKSILSQIERDSTNPTIATVWRICAALERSPESFFRVGEEERSGIALLSANATPEIQSEDGRCRLRILGAIETVEKVKWYEFAADAGGELLSSAHGAGSVEHLTVIEGTLTVVANGDTKTAGVGETLRYATAQGDHVVRNSSGAPAKALMVCVL